MELEHIINRQHILYQINICLSPFIIIIIITCTDLNINLTQYLWIKGTIHINWDIAVSNYTFLMYKCIII